MCIFSFIRFPDFPKVKCLNSHGSYCCSGAIPVSVLYTNKMNTIRREQYTTIPFFKLHDMLGSPGGFSSLM